LNLYKQLSPCCATLTNGSMFCAQSVVNYEVNPPDGICHWRIDVEDDESADLLHQLPTAVTWLERSMRQAGSKVLVHCNAGRVRVFCWSHQRPVHCCQSTSYKKTTRYVRLSLATRLEGRGLAQQCELPTACRYIPQPFSCHCSLHEGQGISSAGRPQGSTWPCSSCLPKPWLHGSAGVVG
jgi:hypothetical protein